MSLTLDNGTLPAIDVYSHGTKVVSIGVHDVSMEDFRAMVLYVMTNTDLAIDDPRLLLFNDLKHMAVIPGHNPGGRRIGRPH